MEWNAQILRVTIQQTVTNACSHATPTPIEIQNILPPHKVLSHPFLLNLPVPLLTSNYCSKSQCLVSVWLSRSTLSGSHPGGVSISHSFSSPSRTPFWPYHSLSRFFSHCWFRFLKVKTISYSRLLCNEVTVTCIPTCLSEGKKPGVPRVSTALPDQWEGRKGRNTVFHHLYQKNSEKHSSRVETPKVWWGARWF